MVMSIFFNTGGMQRYRFSNRFFLSSSSLKESNAAKDAVALEMRANNAIMLQDALERQDIL